MQKLLDEAMPMVQLLWQRETEGKVFDSPERKAALDKALREKIKRSAIRRSAAITAKRSRTCAGICFHPRPTSSVANQSGGFGKGGWQTAAATRGQHDKISALAAGQARRHDASARGGDLGVAVRTPMWSKNSKPASNA